MSVEEDVAAIKFNVQVLLGESRALLNILGALVSETLDSEQKRRFAALLEKRSQALHREIPDEDTPRGAGVAKEGERLLHEQRAYELLIRAAGSKRQDLHHGHR
ncbi:MAG: hypothetical protein OXF11_16605 [Deltaproteobacteria bacterium]|nr:hypothetical protein [Deltaproteobacteria bacterium]